MEIPYMLVLTGTIYFLIETDRIESVVSNRKKMDGEIPVFLCSRLCSLKETAEMSRYVLILNTDGERFGLAVEMAEGLLNVTEEEKLPLAAEVRGSENRYLEAAVSIEKEQCPMAYCLNISELYKKAAETEPSYWI